MFFLLPAAALAVCSVDDCDSPIFHEQLNPERTQFTIIRKEDGGYRSLSESLLHLP